MAKQYVGARCVPGLGWSCGLCVDPEYQKASKGRVLDHLRTQHEVTITKYDSDQVIVLRREEGREFLATGDRTHFNVRPGKKEK